MGVDLKKNPLKVRQAYFDPHGITKRFNLNLLKRVNRELGGSFDIEQFDFYCYYNPLNGELRSFIVSLCKQEVWIEATKTSYPFEKGEVIWTELSKKYDLDELENLKNSAIGYTKVKQLLFDMFPSLVFTKFSFWKFLRNFRNNCWHRKE